MADSENLCEDCEINEVRHEKVIEIKDIVNIEELSEFSTLLEEYDRLCSAVQNYEKKLEAISSSCCNKSSDGDPVRRSLHHAVRTNDVTALENLLDNGGHINSLDKQGFSPFHLAVKYGYNVVAKFLFQRGASIDICNYDEQPPLHTAVFNQNSELVSFLLENRASVSQKCNQGDTALHVVARNGNAAIVKDLLAQGASITALNKWNNTPIHAALKCENEKVALILLEFAVEKSFKNFLAESVLQLVVLNNYDKLTEFILKNNLIDSDLSSKSDITPIYSAAEKIKSDIWVKLWSKQFDFSDEKGRNLLHLSAERNDYWMTWKFVGWFRNVNKVTVDNITPLFIACERGNRRLCDLLLSHHANPNISSSDGRSPLHAAVKANRYDIADLLLQKEANVNAKTEDNITALHIATRYGNKEMCELLIKFEAEPDISDNDGNTPLLLALEKGHSEIFELLLENATDINVKTKTGITLLRIACDQNDTDLCERLLNAKVDPKIYDEDGKSPLHVAIQNLNYKLSEMLLEKHADVNAKTKSTSQTPLSIAIKHRNVELCKLLFKFKVNPNILGCDGKLPLHLVADDNSCTIAELLFQNKANVNQKIKGGITPLHAAAECGNKNMCKLLLSNKAKIDTLNSNRDSPLFLAVKNKHYDVAELLLTNKACCDRSLRHACERNDMKMCKLLIKFGANTHDSSYSALCYAAGNSKYEFAELFLQNTTNVNKFLNCNPLCLAVKKEDLQMCSLLVRFGADSSIVCHHSKSPLWFAVENRNLEITTLFLRNAGDVNQKFKDFKPLIQQPIPSGNLELMKVLLVFGADLDWKSYGSTELETAINEGKVEIVQLLLEHFADVNLIEEYDINSRKARSLTVEVKREITKLLQTHVVMLKVAGFFLKEALFNMPDDRVSLDFQEKCQLEVAMLRSEDIYDTDMSLYDVLNCSFNQLVYFLRNESLQVFLEEYSWQEKYSVYRKLMQNKVSKALAKRKMLDESELIFQKIFPLPLPEICLAQIMSHFADKDLRKLVHSFKPNAFQSFLKL